VLHLLRVIHHAGDNHVHELFADYNIGNEQFIALADAGTKRIAAIKSALTCIAENQLAPRRLLDRALIDAQLTQYRECCQQPTSFDIEYREADFPLQFLRYLQLVRQGDRYTALANSALRKKSLKKDYLGQTTTQRFFHLAEGSYESAVMDLTDLLEPLQGMPFDHAQAERIRLILDRPVDCRVGYEPNADPVCVPRLKTSRSKYAIKDDIASATKHEHLLGCQRDALIPAALELLYGKQERKEDAQTADILRNKLAQLKQAVRRDD
jgi:hypothetical protein